MSPSPPEPAWAIFVLAAQVPGDFSHEGYLAPFAKQSFKQLFFGLVGLAEVLRVVYIETQVLLEWWKMGSQLAREDALLMITGAQSQVKENILNGVVPVIRASAEIISSLSKEPQVTWLAKRTSTRRPTDDSFVLR
jgi:hypothetical protein